MTGHRLRFSVTLPPEQVAKLKKLQHLAGFASLAETIRAALKCYGLQVGPIDLGVRLARRQRKGGKG